LSYVSQEETGSKKIKGQGGAKKMSTRQEKELIGYRKLKGDCKDYSGKDNHGKNHGVNLANSAFNCTNSYIEVEHNDLLNFGKNNFSISAWVYTEKDLLDVIGDIISN